MKKKYSYKELTEAEELPLELLKGKYDKTKDVVQGLEITIDTKSIMAEPKKYLKIKENLHSKYAQRNTTWYGSHSPCTRRNFQKPEMAIVGSVIEAINKTVYPKIILHRVFKDLKEMTELNPITRKDAIVVKRKEGS